MAPNRRHIVPNPNSGWDVKAPGAKRASVHAETQAEAQSAARRILHNAGGGELVTHNVKGQIRAADTVAPGNDPTVSKG